MSVYYCIFFYLLKNQNFYSTHTLILHIRRYVIFYIFLYISLFLYFLRFCSYFFLIFFLFKCFALCYFFVKISFISFRYLLLLKNSHLIKLNTRKSMEYKILNSKKLRIHDNELYEKTSEPSPLRKHTNNTSIFIPNYFLNLFFLLFFLYSETCCL